MRNSGYMRHRCSLCFNMGLQLITAGINVIKCFGVSSLAYGGQEVLPGTMSVFWYGTRR